MDRNNCSELAGLAFQKSAHCCKSLVNFGCKYCAFPPVATCFLCLMCLCESQAVLVEGVFDYIRPESNFKLSEEDDIQDPLDRI